MKMKRIISAVAAMIMSFTAFSALTVNAADVSGQNVIDVTQTKLTDLCDADYDVYQIDFYVTNLEINAQQVKSGPKVTYTGQSVIGMTAKFAAEVDGATAIFDEDIFVMEAASPFTDSQPMVSDAGDKTSIGFAGTIPMFPKKDGESVSKDITLAATDRTKMYGFQLYVPAGSETVLKFDADGFMLNTAMFTKDSIGETTNYVNCSAISNLVLGETVEEDKTETRYYEADLAAADTATGFCFDVNNGTDTATTKTFDFTTKVAEAESVTVGLEITEVPVEAVLTVFAKLVF